MAHPKQAITDEEQRLGEQLVTRGLLDRIQLQYAQQKQQVTGERLSQVLVRLGLVHDAALARLLAEHFALPFCEPETQPRPQPQALQLFTREACVAHALLPLYIENGQLHALLGNGDPQRAAELIRRRSGLEPRLMQAEFGRVSRALDEVWGSDEPTSRAPFEREYQRLRQDAQGALPIDELVQQLLQLAVRERATDIHLQPEPRSLHVAFRIDGVLVPIAGLDPALKRLVAAIKVRAAMDISDNLRPQDGRFSATLNGQPHDIRVSTTVTPAGENVVLRLLPKGVSVAGLEELGFAPEHLGLINTLFDQPHGVFLMTGPTGSGKTTTLHAGLKPHGMKGKSILSVEDPIEYELPVACQTQVNRKAGYTFDTAIRHFLRHDPDIMLVGEIRDAETAQAAMRAAETGHLVLSTLHVNSVFGVVGRLHALGVPCATTAETLVGSINQRLVRRVCPHCCERAEVPADLPGALAERLQGVDYVKGRGCPACGHTGYHGRLPVYEMLIADEAVSRWIEEGGARRELASVLHAGNHVPMWETCASRIIDGQTTLEEFQRIFGLHDTALLQLSGQL